MAPCSQLGELKRDRERERGGGITQCSNTMPFQMNIHSYTCDKRGPDQNRVAVALITPTIIMFIRSYLKSAQMFQITTYEHEEMSAENMKTIIMMQNSDLFFFHTALSDVPPSSEASVTSEAAHTGGQSLALATSTAEGKAKKRKPKKKQKTDDTTKLVVEGSTKTNGIVDTSPKVRSSKVRSSEVGSSGVRTSETISKAQVIPNGDILEGRISGSSSTEPVAAGLELVESRIASEDVVIANREAEKKGRRHIDMAEGEPERTGIRESATVIPNEDAVEKRRLSFESAEHEVDTTDTQSNLTGEEVLVMSNEDVLKEERLSDAVEGESGSERSLAGKDESASAMVIANKEVLKNRRISGPETSSASKDERTSTLVISNEDAAKEGSVSSESVPSAEVYSGKNLTSPVETLVDSDIAREPGCRIVVPLPHEVTERDAGGRDVATLECRSRSGVEGDQEVGCVDKDVEDGEEEPDREVEEGPDRGVEDRGYVEGTGVEGGGVKDAAEEGGVEGEGMDRRAEDGVMGGQEVGEEEEEHQEVGDKGLMEGRQLVEGEEPEEEFQTARRRTLGDGRSDGEYFVAAEEGDDREGKEGGVDSRGGTSDFGRYSGELGSHDDDESDGYLESVGDYLPAYYRDGDDLEVPEKDGAATMTGISATGHVMYRQREEVGIDDSWQEMTPLASRDLCAEFAESQGAENVRVTSCGHRSPCLECPDVAGSDDDTSIPCRGETTNPEGHERGLTFAYREQDGAAYCAEWDTSVSSERHSLAIDGSNSESERDLSAYYEDNAYHGENGASLFHYPENDLSAVQDHERYSEVCRNEPEAFYEGTDGYTEGSYYSDEEVDGMELDTGQVLHADSGSRVLRGDRSGRGSGVGEQRRGQRKKEREEDSLTGQRDVLFFMRDKKSMTELSEVGY